MTSGGIGGSRLGVREEAQGPCPSHRGPSAWSPGGKFPSTPSLKEPKQNWIHELVSLRASLGCRLPKLKARHVREHPAMVRGTQGTQAQLPHYLLWLLIYAQITFQHIKSEHQKHTRTHSTHILTLGTNALWPLLKRPPGARQKRDPL